MLISGILGVIIGDMEMGGNCVCQQLAKLRESEVHLVARHSHNGKSGQRYIIAIMRSSSGSVS